MQRSVYLRGGLGGDATSASCLTSALGSSGGGETLPASLARERASQTGRPDYDRVRSDNETVAGAWS